MRQKLALIALLVFLTLAGILSARAQSGEGYDLTWHTVDNGGAAFSTGDGYQLGGAIGQPDVGMWGDGGYTLVGGFWGGAVVRMQRIYLPLVLRNSL